MDNCLDFFFKVKYNLYQCIVGRCFLCAVPDNKAVVFCFVFTFTVYANALESEFLMLLSILAAAACLAATTIMYSPKMRSFRYYRPVAFLFLFEGVWIVADYVFAQLMPGNVFMQIIHYVGIIAIIIYLVILIIFNSNKRIRKQK